jgi:hypothetical protein
MRKLIAILPLMLLISACNQSAPSTDTAGIVAGSDAWETALNAGDIDALVNLYTEDARLLPPDGEMEVWHRGDDGAWRIANDIFNNDAAPPRPMQHKMNMTGLVIGVRDMDALNAMLSSDEGKAAAAEDGVRPDTITMMTQSN